MQDTSAYLRTATEKDMELLYEWANDMTVRANAFSTEQIPYVEHKGWFTSKLKDKDTQIYIYMYEEKPVGQVRINIEGDGAVIDYSIDVHYRQRGHGKRMLKLLELEVQARFPQIKCLRAQVKCKNNASKAVFVTSGYEEQYVEFYKKLQ